MSIICILPASALSWFFSGLLKIFLTANSMASAFSAGINSAKEAGMKVLAVTNTFSSGYLYEADAIASSLAEVNRKTLEDLIY